MDYFIKASAILAIFYIVYKLLLERETFFQSNRIFLIVGIISSLCIPLIVVPIYTEQQITTLPFIIDNVNATAPTATEESFDWMQLIQTIYLTGVLLISIKLLISLSSLLRFIIIGNSKNIEGFKIIETDAAISPFSFFQYIVYNPTLFKQEELTQILTHEKVHAYQWHSFDVLLSQVMTITFWFNPFSWFYKKDLQQNLEFIADSVSQEQLTCKKSYQKLLLKSSTNTNQLALANNFYNSLIKKRIIMLHKNKSQNKNQWKFALVLPLLTAFILTFQTKVVAQKPSVKEIKVKEVHENIEAFLITKETKDFDKLTTLFSEKEITAKFKNIKRNSDDEITGIKIDLSSKHSSANFSTSSDEPINTIKISFEKGGKNLSIGNTTEHSHLHEKGENVFVIRTNDGDHEKHIIKEIKTDGENPQVIEIEKGKNVWVTKDGDKTIEIITDEGDHKVVEVKSDKNVWVTRDGDKEKHEVIEIKTEGETGGAIFIREDTDGESDVQIKLSDSDKKPLIIVDGKEMPYKTMEDLDPNKIESMNVLKGESAEKKYGDKAKNGVIEITTKKK